MESREILTMRAMEWQRAKGSLNAILNTYWSDEGNFETVDTIIENFMKEMYELLE